MLSKIKTYAIAALGLVISVLLVLLRIATRSRDKFRQQAESAQGHIDLRNRADKADREQKVKNDEDIANLDTTDRDYFSK